MLYIGHWNKNCAENKNYAGAWNKNCAENKNCAGTALSARHNPHGTAENTSLRRPGRADASGASLALNGNDPRDEHGTAGLK